jgi:hypothetical protein
LIGNWTTFSNDGHEGRNDFRICSIWCKQRATCCLHVRIECSNDETKQKNKNNNKN